MAISPSQSPRHISQRLPSPDPLIELPPLRQVSRFSSPMDDDTSLPPSSSQLFPLRSSRISSPRLSHSDLRDFASPYPRPVSSPPPNVASTSTHGKPVRRRKRRESKGHKVQSSSQFVSEFPLGPVLPASRSQKSLHAPRSRIPAAPVPHRSTLEREFYVFSYTTERILIDTVKQRPSML